VATVLELGVVGGVIVLTQTRFGRVPLSRGAALLWGAAGWLAAAGAIAASLVLVSGEGAEPVGPGSSAGTLGGPHLIHFVVFLCAAAALIVYSAHDRRKVRRESPVRR
jgi:hypothetical protein